MRTKAFSNIIVVILSALFLCSEFTTGAKADLIELYSKQIPLISILSSNNSFSNQSVYNANGKAFPNEKFKADGTNPYCNCGIPLGKHGPEGKNHGCCWNYAAKAYKYIWGRTFDRTRTKDNMLRNVPADERKTTVENLKRFFAVAVPGAVLRLDKKSSLKAGDKKGHSLVFLCNNDKGDGAVFLEGNYNAKGNSRIYEWKWEKLVKEYGKKYKYIKYIMWPDAEAFSSSGAPAESNSYTPIYTPEDLDNIRNNLNGKYILMNDIDLSSFDSWVPIGDVFTGVFDGNGHNITNMSISSCDGVKSYNSFPVKYSSNSINIGYPIGLFSIIDGGTIKNINRLSGRIRLDEPECACIGGIAGYASDATIYRCRNDVSIDVAGKAQEQSSFTTQPELKMGGIAGWIDTSEEANKSSYIEECMNCGEIYARLSYNKGVFAGGMVGCGSATFNNCANYGNITAIANSLRSDVNWVGGIIGYAKKDDFRIERCINIGKLLVKNRDKDIEECVGGILGGAFSCKCAWWEKDYYLINSAKRGIDLYDDDVKALSEKAMRLQESFKGIDFKKTWEMGSGNYNYPVLKWFDFSDSEPVLAGFNTCRLIELTSLDYLAFSYIAYEKNTKDGLTVKDIIGNRWTKEWANGISYSDLFNHVSEWKQVASSEPNNEGFYAVAFGNEANEILIAYRGSVSFTDPFGDLNDWWGDWWKNNGKMLMNQDGSQIKYATAFYNYICRRFNTNRIGITGHSLGGALGIIASAYSGSKAETFNAAPFLDVAYSYYPELMGKVFAGTDVWNYIDHENENDLIGTFGNLMKNRVVHEDRKLAKPHQLESFVYKKDDNTISLTKSSDYQVNGISWIMPAWITVKQWNSLPVGQYLDLGTKTDDKFYGIAGADSAYEIAYQLLSGVYYRSVFGGDGSDEAYTGTHNDTLVGGKGGDILCGYSGDDNYYFYKGDGIDYIIDTEGTDHLYLLGFDDTDVIHGETTEDSEYINVYCNNDVILKIDRECRALWSRDSFFVSVERNGIVKEEKLDKNMFKPKNYIARFVIACPVEIEVLNSNGEVVYLVNDEEESFEYNEYGCFTTFAENEDGELGRLIDLTEGYSLRILGKADGKMSIAKQNITNGEYSKRILYMEEIPVKEGMSAVFTSEENKEYLKIDEDKDGVYEKTVELNVNGEENIKSTESPVTDNEQGKVEKEEKNIAPYIIAACAIVGVVSLFIALLIKKHGRKNKTN